MDKKDLVKEAIEEAKKIKKLAEENAKFSAKKMEETMMNDKIMEYLDEDDTMETALSEEELDAILSEIQDVKEEKDDFDKLEETDLDAAVKELKMADAKMNEEDEMSDDDMEVALKEFEDKASEYSMDDELDSALNEMTPFGDKEEPFGDEMNEEDDFDADLDDLDKALNEMTPFGDKEEPFGDEMNEEDDFDADLDDLDKALNEMTPFGDKEEPFGDEMNEVDEFGNSLDEALDELEEDKGVGITVNKSQRSQKIGSMSYGSKPRAGANLEEMLSVYKKALAENQKANKILKDKLSEMAVLNTNLAHLSTLFMENAVTKQERISIAKKFDKVKTIEESKNLYESLKTQITESISNKKLEIDKKVKGMVVENTVKIEEKKDAVTLRILDIMNKIK